MAGATKKKTDKATEEEGAIDVGSVKLREIEFYVLGDSGFICNCLSEKTRHELLYPKGRKSAQEKASSLKHDPLTEFRNSPYTNSSEDAPTLIEMLAVSFKRCIESMALDAGTMSKARLSRCITALGQKVSLYGIPLLKMDNVRCKSSVGQGTPDIRTRAILPRWACKVTLQYPVPIVQLKTVQDYLILAGQLRGVGDYRPEKGAGDFGRFKCVEPDNREWNEIVSTQGRKEQVAAMESPDLADDDTRRLYDWFTNEVEKRGHDDIIDKTSKRSKAATNGVMA